MLYLFELVFNMWWCIMPWCIQAWTAECNALFNEFCWLISLPALTEGGVIALTETKSPQTMPNPCLLASPNTIFPVLALDGFTVVLCS